MELGLQKSLTAYGKLHPGIKEGEVLQLFSEHATQSSRGYSQFEGHQEHQDNYDGLVEEVTRSLSNMKIKPPQEGCLAEERQEVWEQVYNARLRPGM